MNVETAVAEAIAEALQLPSDTDFAALTYRGHPKWSSLGHMTLVAVLEDRFDTMLDADDILEMSSFPKIVEIMSRYATD